MNRNKKITKITVAAGMAAVLGVNPVSAAEQAAENQISKEETVYVNADSDGSVQEIIVSDWLKNSGGEGEVEDFSDLENIKLYIDPLKGSESHSRPYFTGEY